MKQDTNFSIRLLRSTLTMAFFPALCGAIVATSSAAHAASPTTERSRLLANPSDIVSLTATEKSAIRIFLSYTGKEMNHCGIRIRLSSYADIKEFAQKVAILDGAGNEIGELTSEGYVAKVANPDDATFGQTFVVQSRNRRKLATVIADLSTFEPTDAVAEILPCN